MRKALCIIALLFVTLPGLSQDREYYFFTRYTFLTHQLKSLAASTFEARGFRFFKSGDPMVALRAVSPDTSTELYDRLVIYEVEKNGFPGFKLNLERIINHGDSISYAIIDERNLSYYDEAWGELGTNWKKRLKQRGYIE